MITPKRIKRITSVRIIHMVDDSPDTSWLGEYSNKRTSEFSIDRGEHGDMERGQCRYFNPSFNYVDKSGRALEENTPKEVRKYVNKDYERMESLNAGQWSFIGIRAECEIAVPTSPGNATIQRITSGGLWGIESDSGRDFIEETEQEQLSELRAQLKALGFSTRAISTAFKNVEHKEDW